MSRINLALGPDGPSPDEWEAETAADTESTSARLRRVEQERDEALAVQRDAINAFIRMSDQLTIARSELASARAELELVRRQLADEQAARLDAEARLNQHGGAP